MDKCKLNELLDKILRLEKMLMRDLDEREIDYLMSHDINEFLNNVLGFNREDLRILSKLRTAISNWCTRPEGAFDMDDIDWNIFKDDGYLEGPNDVDLYKDDPITTGRGVVDVLSTIIKELQEELDRYEMDMSKIEEVKTKKREPELFDSLDEQFTPPSVNLSPDLIDKILKAGVEAVEKESKHKNATPEDYNCHKGSGFELESDSSKSVLDILDAIPPLPDEVIKWTKDFTNEDFLEAMERSSAAIANDHLEKWNKIMTEVDAYESISEFVDKIKDIAIEKHILNLELGETIIFEDEEIQMEVLDYLYKNKYRVKSIENKVSLI